MQEKVDSAAPEAPKPAIFTIDLGSNGGVFAPTTAKEMHDWILVEEKAWSWCEHAHTGNHTQAIKDMIGRLKGARNAAEKAMKDETSSQEAFSQNAHKVEKAIRSTFVESQLPHSSSTLAKRIEQFRVADPAAALAYLFVYMPQAPNYQFDARDLGSWRGFLAGIFERYGLQTLPDERLQAERLAFDGLHSRMEQLLGEKKSVFGDLHRHYERLTVDLGQTDEKHKIDFAEFLKTNQKTHDDALTQHKAAMSTLEQVFREKMSLRAPVEYWEKRKNFHKERLTIMGRWAFGSIAGLAITISGIAYWVLNNLTKEGKPEAWRVAVLILVGVLGIWAVRLIVRMFLSNMHLATDADERVTMVQTYLSLLEAEKMPSDDDRKLILQALFRPASDGIVKDEGLPHPFLELLTRSSNK